MVWKKHALIEQLKHEQGPLLLSLVLKTALHMLKVQPQLTSEPAKTPVKISPTLTPRGGSMEHQCRTLLTVPGLPVCDRDFLLRSNRVSFKLVFLLVSEIIIVFSGPTSHQWRESELFKQCSDPKTFPHDACWFVPNFEACWVVDGLFGTASIDYAICYLFLFLICSCFCPYFECFRFRYA